MRVPYKKNIRRFQEPLILFVSILLLLLVSHDFFFRIDLTTDKKYSINRYTETYLRDLKENIEIEVYLEGDLPINFKKFRNSIKEKLKVFKEKSKNINFKFVDVQKLSVKKRNKLYKRLMKQNIYATTIFIRDRGKRIEKIIFPIAKISFKDKHYYLKLFKTEKNTPTHILIHKATQNLEYNFIRAISVVTIKSKKKIGIIKDCGGPNKKRLYMISKSIRNFYDLDFIKLNLESNVNSYDALIIVKPTKPFSDKAKYILDQYIMNGGKVLFFISTIKISYQNLIKGLDFAFPTNTNLSDMLFKYGVRINQDLIKDINSAYYPIVIGGDNKNLKIEWLKWPFFPILSIFGEHVTTKGINSISSRFISSIDVIKNDNVNKIPLIFTSRHSNKVFYPIKIDLNDLRKDIDPNQYNQGPIPIAYLLEGNFSSYYQNKFIPEGFSKENFKEQSKFTQLLVVSTGDLIMNDIDPKTNSPIELGHDHYFNHTFSQKEFILNILDYMLNENGLIFSKNKNIKLRLLDMAKIKGHYLIWQIINIIVPVLILLLWAIIWNFFYKRKNTILKVYEDAEKDR